MLLIRSVLVVTSVCVALLCGCGGDSEPDTSNSGDPGGSGGAPNESGGSGGADGDSGGESGGASGGVGGSSGASGAGGSGGSSASGGTSGASATGGLPETGVELSAACETAGGVLCTATRWEICPVGFEPLTADSHHDCGGGVGWCCVQAPDSSCTQADNGNCVPDSCSGCWGPVPDTALTCEAGRVCCLDNCY